MSDPTTTALVAALLYEKAVANVLPVDYEADRRAEAALAKIHRAGPPPRKLIPRRER